MLVPGSAPVNAVLSRRVLILISDQRQAIRDRLKAAARNSYSCVAHPTSKWISDHRVERVGKFSVPKSGRTQTRFAPENRRHPPTPVFHQDVPE